MKTEIYKKNEKVIIIISIIVGLLAFVGFQYYSNNMISVFDIVSAVVALIIIVIILILANKFKRTK